MKYLNANCLDYMKEFDDNYFDIAVVDPPYGIGEHGGKVRGTSVKQKNGSRTPIKSWHEKLDWDKDIPTQEYFDQLFRVSKHQIIFGINYFTEHRDLPIGSGRIIWDKVNTGNFSDCEIAGCSLHKTTRLVRYMWNGMLQGKSIREGWRPQGNKKLYEKRIHPTQKPTILYQWIAQQYFKEGWLILDTHVGSASSLIAYELEGYQYLGFEKEKKYYKDSTSRIQQFRKKHENQLFNITF